MELIEQSIGQGVVPTIIITIYLIITRIIDNRSNTSQITLNNNFIEAVSKIANYMDAYNKAEIEKNKDRVQLAIRNTFKASANNLIKFATYTIINNNIIVNKKNIIESIHTIVNNEYYTVCHAFTVYQTDDIKLVNFIKLEWKDELIKIISEIIYDESLTKEQRIYNINNQINIKTSDYCTYVINKYIEHE